MSNDHVEYSEYEDFSQGTSVECLDEKKRLVNCIKGIQVYNTQINYLSEGLKHKSINQVRKLALLEMRKNRALNPQLINLLEYFKCRYPHWFNGNHQIKEESMDVVISQCLFILNRISVEDNKFVSITFEEMQDKRIRTVHLHPNKTAAVPIRRRKRKNTTCEIHPNKKAVSHKLCAACYQRIRKLKNQGIIKVEMPRDLLLRVLLLPAVRGKSSTFVTDATVMIKQYI